MRIPVGRGFAGRIAAGHKPVILDHVDHTTVLNPILWQKGIRSMMGVPLVAGGRVIGVLHVGSLTPANLRTLTSSCCKWPLSVRPSRCSPSTPEPTGSRRPPCSAA